MESNLTGTWTGELSGTNSGGMLLQIQHDSDRIYGSGRFYEPTLGSYEYEIQGVARGQDLAFFLTPRPGQPYQLGTVQAKCQIADASQLSGTWTSSIGTAGVFTLKRADQKRTPPPAPTEQEKAKSVFLVHGHDEATKEKVARFLEKIGLEVIILHEQVNQGMTVIEKFEEYASRANFAVVLFTPDDVGYPLASESSKRPRARQNVVLEMGYFIGKLRRDRVCVLYKGGVELPSDIFGVIYHSIDDAGGWKLAVAGELRAAGYPVDLNKIVA